MNIAARFAAAAAGLLMVALAAGDAQAARLKVGFHNITHAEMVPESSTVQYFIDWSNGLRNDGGNLACFSTAVRLPHGATITGAIVRYSSGPNTTPGVVINRHRLKDNSLSTVANTAFEDNTGQMKSAAVGVLNAEVAKINNAQYAYSFAVCLGALAGDKFYSARIRYTYVD